MTTTDIKETKVTGRAPRLRAQIALCFFAFILIGANDGAFGVLIPSMRSHYGVSNATIGLLFLFASVGYLIAAFNSGLLVAKLGNRLFLLLGVGAFLFASTMISLMPPFTMFVVHAPPARFWRCDTRCWTQCLYRGFAAQHGPVELPARLLWHRGVTRPYRCLWAIGDWFWVE